MKWALYLGRHYSEAGIIEVKVILGQEPHVVGAVYDIYLAGIAWSDVIPSHLPGKH